MQDTVWADCLATLKEELPGQQFNTWLRPLHGEFKENILHLYAPNKFVLDWVKEKFLKRINELLTEKNGQESVVTLNIGAIKKQDDWFNHVKPINKDTAKKINLEQSKQDISHFMIHYFESSIF